MNRTTRSTLALLLALCLMMAVFAGCTSKSSAETVNNAESTSTSTAAAAADTYIIGLDCPMTGGNASFGEQPSYGAQMAVDEVNANGGSIDVRKMSKALGIPVFSYIPPSAWAWRRGRAKMVAGLCTKVACIYPFAAQVYQEAGANVEFVGNPLVDIVQPEMSPQEAEAFLGKRPGHPVVLLLPGSRVKEITGVLPVMLQALPLIKKQQPDVDFVLQKAPSIDRDLLDSLLARSPEPVKVVEGHNYDVMTASDAALATSGTVTLEAALCGLPSVICYRASALSIFLARQLVYVKYIGLPNILAGKEILPELIQENMTPERMASAVLAFLEPEGARSVRRELQQAVAKLGKPGAVDRTAALILETAKEKE